MRGSIIIYVLWALTLVSSLTMFMVGGLYFYRINLSKAGTKYVQTLEMFAIANIMLTQVRNEVFVSKDLQHVVNKQEVISYQRRTYTVKVEPEDAKLSINAYDEQTIERLLLLLGFKEDRARQVAGKIVQERDLKGLKFVSLAQIKIYMTQREYEMVKDYMTVAPTMVNVNYANKTVLQAVGFNKSDAEYIVSMRDKTDFFSKESLKPLFPGKEGIIDRLLSSRRLPEYFKIKVYSKDGQRLSCILNKIGNVVDCGDDI